MIGNYTFNISNSGTMPLVFQHLKPELKPCEFRPLFGKTVRLDSDKFFGSGQFNTKPFAFASLEVGRKKKQQQKLARFSGATVLCYINECQKVNEPTNKLCACSQRIKTMKKTNSKC